MSDNKDRLEERLVRSETSLAHLSHDLEQINGVVVEHTRDLQSISRLISSIEKRLRALEQKGEED